MFHFSLPGISKQLATIVKEAFYHHTPETLVESIIEAPLNFTPVHKLFEEQVALNELKTCLVYGSKSVTFNEVNSRANQLAHYLIARGIKVNQYVPICINRSIDFVIAMLAIFKAGGVYVPIDTGMPYDRIRFILMDLSAECIICSQQSSELLKDFGTEVIEIDGMDKGSITSQPTKNLLLSPLPNHLAYIIYTSGSTGKPKGVMIEHNAFYHYITNNKTRYINNDNNKAGSYIYLSNAFDASITALFMPMLAGKMAVICTLDKSEVFKDPNFRKYAPYDFLKITPAHLDFLVPTLQDTFNQWVTKRLVIGGEALHAGQLEEFVQTHLNLQIINEYGPTEATVGCTTFSMPLSENRKYKKGVPIGTPINNTCIYLFRDKEGSLHPGLEGEIYIGGYGLAKGYINRNDLTEEKFIINPIKNSPYKRLYKTGDLGKWLPDGNLAYLGRIDDQVKISGYRIELGEIENAVNDINFIVTCCVIALQQGTSKKLVCYYVPEPGKLHANRRSEPFKNNGHVSNKGEELITGTNADITEQIETKLRLILRSKLPEYMMPARFIMLTKIPLTPNGKINRKLLSELSFKDKRQTTIKRSISPKEQKILKIWNRILADENIEASDDFFELSGNSVQAAAIMNLVNRNFSTHLPLTALLQAPTISKLAALLDSSEHTTTSSCIYAFRSGGTRAPLFLLHAGAGDILFYRELVNALNYDQPVYGIMARGLDGQQPPLTNVKDLAGFYADEILRIHPNGPYRLAGYCFGAVLCFEMAHVLTEKNKEVDFLVSINGIAPSYVVAEATIQKDPVVDYGNNLKSKLYYHYKNISSLPVKEALLYPFTRVLHKYKRLSFVLHYRMRLKLYNFFISRNKPLPAMLARKYYFDTNAQMVHEYNPPVLTNSMIVFRSPNLFPEPTLGWKNHVEGPINCIEIPGDHENRRVILDQPYVKYLAEKLDQCLDKVNGNDHYNF